MWIRPRVIIKSTPYLTGRPEGRVAIYSQLSVTGRRETPSVFTLIACVCCGMRAFYFAQAKASQVFACQAFVMVKAIQTYAHHLYLSYVSTDESLRFVIFILLCLVQMENTHLRLKSSCEWQTTQRRWSHNTF